MSLNYLYEVLGSEVGTIVFALLFPWGGGVGLRSSFCNAKSMRSLQKEQGVVWHLCKRYLLATGGQQDRDPPYQGT